MRSLLAALVCAWAGAAGAAPVDVVDDSGRSLKLPAPAARIVSLSPHITELLFAAGAGDRVVGTVRYSDYPEAARAVPRVGDIHALDLERIVELKPDLVIVWLRGSPKRQVEVLQALKLPIYFNEPSRLDDVARTLERFGELAGVEAGAHHAAASYRERLAQLRSRYAGREAVRVFFQIWREPLMTINDRHLISDVLALCGGRNVFGALPLLAPQIGIEAVIDADPEVIAVTGDAARGADQLEAWRAWPQLTARRRGNLVVVPDDLISQHTPRILDGAQLLCEQLDRARARRRPPRRGARASN